MKSLYLFTFIFLSNLTFALTYTTTGNGDWNDPAAWDANGSPGTYWGAGDVIIINHDITLNVSIGYAGSLTVNSSGSITGTNRNIALYNGASIVANGEVDIQNLTLNSTSTGNFTDLLSVNNLTVGTNSSLTTNDAVVVDGNLNNNGGTIVGNDTYSIAGNLTNNNGTITFNEATTVGGKFDNNNSSAVININNTFDVTGNIQNNSSATINISGDGVMSTSGNLTNNSGSAINSDGRINADGNFSNNGGTVDNNGIFDLGGNFTQNGGSFTNNGGMIVDGSFTINGGGTVDGSGILRVNEITNHGTFNGTVDVCRQDDSTPTTTNGGGTYNVNLTYCAEASSAALPIKLYSFDGNYINRNTIEVTWLTASELNNDYFTISYSFDGINFIEYKQVSGAGNSNTPLTYRILLSSTQSGPLYIRLKQTDFDGKSETFDPIVVKRTFNHPRQSTGKLHLYPNPGNGSSMNVELKNLDAQEYILEIIESSGKKVLSSMISVEEENRYRTIELLDGKEQLKKGIYFVRLVSQDKTFVEKYIVQ